VGVALPTAGPEAHDTLPIMKLTICLDMESAGISADGQASANADETAATLRRLAEKIQGEHGGFAHGLHAGDGDTIRNSIGVDVGKWTVTERTP